VIEKHSNTASTPVHVMDTYPRISALCRRRHCDRPIYHIRIVSGFSVGTGQTNYPSMPEEKRDVNVLSYFLFYNTIQLSTIPLFRRSLLLPSSGQNTV
jgi:hypothetical protein